MFEEKEKTSIERLGEFKLIDHLTSAFETRHKETLLGVGDDAAILKINNSTQLISTDIFIENIHFDMMYSPLVHIGYKCITASISDIYAMNAQPKQVLVSIAISSKYTLQAAEELYTGIRAACEKYDIDLIGGDTSSSVTGMAITVTAIGYADEDKIVKRSGAKEGDLLCVSGDLGGAYIGLQLLEREKQVFLETKDMQPDLEGKDYVIGRQLRPEARKDIIDLLEDLGIVPTSMIDISDGLSSEVFHLCKQSNIGMKIYEEKLPIDQQTYDTALEFNIPPTTTAMNGGEDYELLFTLPQSQYDKIKNSLDISVIGYCTAAHEGKEIITKSGSMVPLEAQGWDTLSTPEESSTTED
ncbi:MAG: thiamine-monophosphate kinase [Bacteroidia bacterium]|jgi:thiamine-monophosphate kinase|tara:strand:- start:221 stop:1288 length:1068 start_codon:yes stop_codon:yes gene_type:complete